MTDYTKLPEPELEIQYFDKNVLWIGASGASSFSEGETLAQGLVLEYDREGTAVGVVLTMSALNKLKEFLDQNITEHPGTHQTWNSSNLELIKMEGKHPTEYDAPTPPQLNAICSELALAG